MFRRFKNNLVSFDYYFALLVGLIPASFLVVFWLYLKSLGYLSATQEELTIYFLFTAPLGFMFFYSFNRGVVDALTLKPDYILLSPENLIWRLTKKLLFPIIVDATPLGLILCLLAVLMGIFSLDVLVQFLFLLSLSLVNYTFFSIIMAVVAIHLKITDWMDFFLRFVGIFWSGAYIPLVLLPGQYQTIALLLPFSFAGLPLQLVLLPKIPENFLFSVFIYTLVFIFLSRVLCSRYQTYIQQ